MRFDAYVVSVRLDETRPRFAEVEVRCHDPLAPLEMTYSCGLSQAPRPGESVSVDIRPR